MPLSCDDRLDILEVAARYCRALDRGDPEALEAVFTEDAVWESSARGARQGREAIVEEFRGRAAQAHTRKHWTSNPVIEGDGDEASMTLDLLVLHLDDGDVRPGTSGVYEDRLRRDAAGWRIAYRKITVDGSRAGFRSAPAQPAGKDATR